MTKNISKAIDRVGLPAFLLLSGCDSVYVSRILSKEVPAPSEIEAISWIIRGAQLPYIHRSLEILTRETWKPIPGIPNYEASDHANIRRVTSTRRETSYRTLLPNMKSDGYLRVSVYIDGVRKNRTIHRLVCLAFHGEPEPGVDYACHKDGVRTHNLPGNLYWGTAQDNYADQVEHGTVGYLKTNMRTKRDVKKPCTAPKIARKKSVATTLNGIKRMNKIKMLKRIEELARAV